MFDVFLYDLCVGTINLQAETGHYVFMLDDEYLNASNRPVLGQQFEDRRNRDVFRCPIPGKLPTYFANLLPEGALREMLEAQGTGFGDAALLGLVGEDLPGSIVIRAGNSRGREVRSAMAFDEPIVPLSSDSDRGLHFSLAGMQLKFSAVKDDHLRFTLPFRGLGGRWILKFASAHYPNLPENEFFTMSWAAACGLNVPRHELVDANTITGIDSRFLNLGLKVFAIERFDRLHDNSRIHQEDFAQVRGVPPDKKYDHWSFEGIARFLSDLCGPEDLQEFVRRIVFCILVGNTDVHLKNWSLVYPDRQSAHLSPAYDFVFVRYYIPTDLMALSFLKEKDPTKISWAHFERLEKFLHNYNTIVPIVAPAREFMERCLDVWQTHRLKVDPFYSNGIDNYHATLSLIK
jgi:serine/threonine-protein kinase HipA